MVPRLLGAEAFGEYTIVTTIASLASFAVGLGIPDYLVRRVAQQPATARRDVGMAIAITTITALGTGFALAVVLPLLGFPLADVRLLYVALLGILGVPVGAHLASWLRGRDNYTRFAWSNALSVALVAVVGLLVLLAGANVVIYALVGVVVSIGASLLAFKLSGLRPVRPPLDLSLARELVRGGLPFLGCTVTQIIASSVDRVILGALVPAAQVGWYAAAIRIVSIPIFVPLLVAAPLFAAISRDSRDPATVRRAISESLRVVLLVTVPLAAGLVVAAPLIPSILHWPSDFENAVPLIQILSVSMPLMSVNTVLVTGLMALGREAKWVRVALMIAFLNAVINVACIPWFDQVTGDGAIGASIVTGVTELLMFAGVAFLIPKHLLGLQSVWVAGRVVLGGCAGGLAGALLLPVGLPLGVIAGGLIYVGTSLILKVLRPNDLTRLVRNWT